MPIVFKKNQAMFRDVVGVEEAEELLGWLQKKPTATVDLSACSHLHPANLQVLMAAKVTVADWPKDSDLRAWLETALKIG
jgi:hypothetical protein